MKRLIIINSVILLLCIQAAAGQKRISLGLAQCIEMALKNDQRVKTSAMDQDRLKYQRYQTIGTGVPQISASGSFQDFLKLPTQLIPGEFFGMPGEMIPVQFGTNYNMSGGIQVSQLIYNQSFLVSLRISKRMMEKGEIDAEKNKQSVVYDVSQLYFQALLTGMQIGYLRENLGKLDTLTGITRIHLDEGYLKQTDFDRVNVGRINMETEISNLAIMLDAQLGMLKYFTGISPVDTLALSEPVTDTKVLMPQSLSADNHVSLRELDKNRELLHLQMNLAKAQFAPTLAAFGDFSYYNQQNDFGKLFSEKKGWLGTSVVGLTLNVPIFSGMQRYYQVKQARVQYDQLVIVREDAKKLIETGIRNAAERVRSCRETADAQKTNVELAGKVYRVVLDQYRKGYAKLTDLLSAESSLVQAQAAYAQSLVQTKLAELELCKSTGNLLNIKN